jgi:hypothetical protein
MLVSEFLTLSQGPSGRHTQPDDATKEDVLAQIFKSNESANSRDAARLRRQSRISREVVSSGQGWFIRNIDWSQQLNNNGTRQRPNGCSDQGMARSDL